MPNRSKEMQLLDEFMEYVLDPRSRITVEDLSILRELNIVNRKAKDAPSDRLDDETIELVDRVAQRMQRIKTEITDDIPIRFLSITDSSFECIIPDALLIKKGITDDEIFSRSNRIQVLIDEACLQAMAHNKGFIVTSYDPLLVDVSYSRQGVLFLAIKKATSCEEISEYINYDVRQEDVSVSYEELDNDHSAIPGDTLANDESVPILFEFNTMSAVLKGAHELRRIVPYNARTGLPAKSTLYKYKDRYYLHVVSISKNSDIIVSEEFGTIVKNRSYAEHIMEHAEILVQEHPMENLLDIIMEDA